jgi:ubiquitin C-terminal hydrolase
MKLHYFEELNPNKLEDYYSIDIEFEAESRLLKVNTILEKLPEFVGKVNGFIQDNFKTGNDVQEFLDFHLDEVDEELAFLLSKTDQSLKKDEQLLSILTLKRIGFYPDEDETFTVSDFGIGQDISQYVLVVNTTEDQELHYITMES